MNRRARPAEGDLPRREGRSHPPSLIKLAERLIRDERLLARGDVVVCACSGGPDSTALLHVLASLRPRIGHEVVALGVDHGLRPEAQDELALAAEAAAASGVAFSVTRVNVPHGSNLQARARAARLEALREAARKAGARAIATGHTADDRAETFLLRLLRGAGPRGLAVLPPRAELPLPASPDATDAGRIDLIRPLLLARRTDVLAHIHRHRIGHAHDPSNLDPRFTRVRVRREVLPLLQEISPGVVEHLCALADMLGREPGALAQPAGEGEPARLGHLGDLGRAQRQAIERARRLGRSSMRLRLHGGREIDVAFADGTIVLMDED